ncbi:hypothetical protein N8I77_005064 [Diaporthe amygdali]|uniref:Aminoglycoside phosphotransferase domain-containing protein n=1 Tax=Phomopsis amygdali TaxID=1214568 RepID=A0AAD9W7Q6_PHOAM|nr:hypothetical protein N8I77_005064 [Diaporthe amygdali]
MNSPSRMSREDAVTASPRQKAQESQHLPPPSPPPLPSEDDRKPSPLPVWLQLRIKASALLNRSRRHGPGNVVVLPFNKIAKLNVSVTEIAAMNFVRANTSIPVPEILEVHYDAKFEGFANIVMTKLAGDDLADVIQDMSDTEIKYVVKELSGYMKQLRRFDKDIGGNAPAIGGLGGIPGYDSRIASIPFGPFATMADFHTYLRLREPIEDWILEPNVMAVHGKPEGTYKMKLTHGDIAPRNIRVKRGKITGLIDWEFAGWYPEYWEYTRMFFPGERPYLKNWYNAIEEEDGIGKYKTERKAEEAIWSRLGPFGFE